MILSTMPKPAGATRQPGRTRTRRLNPNAPLRNSSLITSSVDVDTLCVEHMEGYAGVMMGMMWFLSVGYICGHKGERTLMRAGSE